MNELLPIKASANVQKRFELCSSLSQKYFELAVKNGPYSFIIGAIRNLQQLLFLRFFYKSVAGADVGDLTRILIKNTGKNQLNLYYLELSLSFNIKHKKWISFDNTTPNDIDFTKIPSNFIIFSLHFNTDLEEIYINRHSNQCNSFSMRLPINRKYSRDGDSATVTFQTFIDEWNDIMELNKSSTNSLKSNDREEKSEWWKNRKALDERIKSLLDRMETLIFGGFKGILTFPANESRLDLKSMTLLRIEIGKILECCVSRTNKCKYKPCDILHPLIIDIIFELSEYEIRNDDLEDVLYFLIDCYQNYGVQMALDEMNIDSVSSFFLIYR